MKTGEDFREEKEMRGENRNLSAAKEICSESLALHELVFTEVL